MNILKFGPNLEDLAHHEDRKNQAPQIPVFFLHGFPGLRSKQNRDFAAEVAAATDRPVELFLYNGLGYSPGEFSFERCLDDVMKSVSSRLQAGEKFDLVGHSWGGFLSLLLAQKFQASLRKLVLISPLLQFSRAQLSQASLQNIIQDHPEVDLGDVNERAREFEAIAIRFPIEKLLVEVSNQTEILFLQSREDSITPTDVAEKMLSYFGRKPTFELVETDHSFLSLRPIVAQRIARFLS